MRHPLHLLGTLTLSLVGLAAQASDFDSLLGVARGTWPESRHLAVVCNYEEGKEQIQALAEAAGSGSHITVVDARSPFHLPGARMILQDRRPDYLVLLPKGRAFRAGSPESTKLVRDMAYRGIPSVGTTPVAIQQGAVFAVGPDTGNEVLVTDRLRGTVSVLLPARGQFIGARAQTGKAEVSVLTLP
ncbi:MAG: hypothetical protein HY823_15685 [Acidobacteria bacterium]|nr:hypothetical protein [Acidobacteriota bacterium]